MFLTLNEAKTYLRVDSKVDDHLILSLIPASEKEVMDVARLSASEWQKICEEYNEEVTIRGKQISADEVNSMRELLRVGVYFALGYLYEHREDGNHLELTLTLRAFLSSIREGVM